MVGISALASLAFTLAALAFQPTPWVLGHLLFLAVLTFWITLVSSVVWCLVEFRLSLLNLDDARSLKRSAMLASALLASALGIAWTLVWSIVLAPPVSDDTIRIRVNWRPCARCNGAHRMLCS